ncbi:lysosomal acid phosphatase-like [Anneissia japonica]|uniref:lysosomal acid phosphatase-like n=1 Tax=Anneissia japonica TaxID=1529436 RepID=UPI001425B9D2|nr:lysosomal acid phosphatase-like [Anneissia japonica]
MGNRQCNKMNAVSLILLFITLLLDIPCNIFAKKHLKLKQVHVLYRHGSRSPSHRYPNDLYDESTWPQGYGMLTQKGMKQQYLLGQWLKDRYVDNFGFLNHTYIAKEIVIHSTDTHRTVMSAQSNLAGLYPPNDAQVWNEEIPWQPIGIFTYPGDQDRVLTFHAPCLKRDRLMEEKSHPLYNKFIENNKEKIDYIIAHAGVDRNIKSLGQVADALYFENEDGRNLPPWTLTDVVGWDGTYYKWLMMLKDFQYSAIYQNTSTELKKLLGGSLLGAMASHFRDVGMNVPSPKLYMYSAHDSSVSSLLSSLNSFNDRLPLPASCILVELYHNVAENSFTVDVLYRNETNRLVELQIGPNGNKCDKHCPLEEFLKYVDSVTPHDFEKECKMHIHHAEPLEWNTGWLIFSVVFTMFLILAVTMCILTIITACKGPVYKPRNRLQPIDFHLLGNGLSESEDEAVFDA